MLLMRSVQNHLYKSNIRSRKFIVLFGKTKIIAPKFYSQPPLNEQKTVALSGSNPRRY